MQNKIQVSLTRKILYGIMMLAVFLSAFGVGNFTSAQAQEAVTDTVTPLADTGIWTLTGSMAVVRWGATETLLPNGKVLIVGGRSGKNTELYDPATGLWTSVGSMVTGRGAHTATLLPNGKVLVAGGSIYNSNTQKYEALTSAELYDPSTGLWTPTGAMTIAHTSHAATLLPNGKVLVVAGTGMVGGKLVGTELYDPATGLWTATGSLTIERESPTVTLLQNGKVLAAGGWGEGYQTASAELYNPATGLWTPTGSMTIAHAAHTATLLSNGKVLVAGSSAELYDPATGLWSPTGLQTVARSYHTATLLPNGKVLTAGGFGVGSVVITSAELYNPVTGLWTATGSMIVARESHSATLLTNGKVLVTGGWSGTSGIVTAELYSLEVTFADVPTTHPQYKYIQALYDAGLTAGCSTNPLKFCPDTILDRAQSAVFMVKGQLGSGFTPPPAPWNTFLADDWSLFLWAQPWAEAMYQAGLTKGCQTSPLKFCPANQLPRVEASIFGLKMKYGDSYTPPPATGTVFADFPSTDPSYWGIAWAEQAYKDGLLPSCGTLNGKPMFCPNEQVNRGWAAYLIVKAKNIPTP